MFCGAMRSQTSIGESAYSSRSHGRTGRPGEHLGAGVLFGFAGEDFASRPRILSLERSDIDPEQCIRMEKSIDLIHGKGSSLAIG